MVVGIVETHGRYDTGSMVIGLELLPRRTLEHRGIQMEELDLDAALKRRPELLLVDELAHTNAPGSRHLKRWQDVEEILAAGIDVFTTLNVQHLESLKDVVAEITSVLVRETVPDAVFDRAYEVRVVDLPVDELLQRLKEGKVYLPQQAARAVDHFFREGNLIALRELALRRTAERVDAKMRGYKAAHGIDATWHTGERVLVCVSPSPHSARLVRAARRMATSLHAELLGVYVETPAALRVSAGDRDRLAENMRLVESLGGESVVLRAEDAAVETVRYARKRNATKIVVGKPTHPRWYDFVRPSFLDDLVRKSLEIDLYVISGRPGEIPTPPAPAREVRRRSIDLWGGAAAVAVVAACTALGWYGFGKDELADVVMIDLLGVVVVSMRYGYVPSLLAAVLAVVSFDFFFIQPYFSFAVSDLRHLVTFVVMFLVAVIISHLTKRIRGQADSARQARAAHGQPLRHQPRARLRAGARPAAANRGASPARGVRRARRRPLARRRRHAGGGLRRAGDTRRGGQGHGRRRVGLAQPAAGGRVDGHAAVGARALRSAEGRRAGASGCWRCIPSAETRLGDPEERQLLETFAGLIGSALERTQLAEEARRSHLRAETEQLRNSLLSSVSHDLRTPLAVVTGATSSLLDEHGPKDEGTRRELLMTAHEEALRLNRLVRNLLDMTRLEAGALNVKKDLEPIEEVVGSALGRMEDRLRGREVQTHIPEDLPLVPFDSALIEQVLINLLENATKYTPAGSALSITASTQDGNALIEVADRGPGVSAQDRERVFDKFYRAREGEGGGVGLGLTICRGIVAAHGGRIWVEERSGGGASFRFTLPLEATTRVQPAPLAESRESEGR